MCKQQFSSPLNVNIISVNVKGIRTFAKRQKVFNWLARKKVDVILLQETYSTVEVERYWKHQWKGDMYFSHGTTHSKGVTVLFNSKFECDIKACNIDQNGRYIILDLETQGNQMVIVNAYAPCSSKP